MPINKTPEKLRDFALYALKAYQDILLVAFERDDLETTNVVLEELGKALRGYLEKERKSSISILQIEIDRAENEEEKLVLSAERQQLINRKDIADSIELSKGQLLFGIAARALELFVIKHEERERYLRFVQALFARLPTNLPNLTRTFDSIQDSRAEDFWGWHWFDFKPDGEAHTVDTHSRSNRLYTVRALQILAELTDEQIAALAIECGENLDFVFAENNSQGIPEMVREIRDTADQYGALLSANAIAKVDALLKLLAIAKAQLESQRQLRLAAARIDQNKLLKFKKTVLDAYLRGGRFRAWLEQAGCYHNRLSERAGANVKSWGYNQLDDKAAFISDWHVSYNGWGEAYGRGLAQAEDQNVFSTMVEQAHHTPDIEKGNLIPEIGARIRSHRIKDAVVLQSLRSTLEYDEIRRRDLFIPRYRPDCPKTAFTGLDGFLGVLKYEDMVVPVLDVFVRNGDLRDTVVIANIKQFISWNQYCPSDEKSEDVDIIGMLLVKVIDLSADDERRSKLMVDNPPWLQQQKSENRELFLKTRVVVNVYEKYDLGFSPESAVTFKVSMKSDTGQDAG